MTREEIEWKNLKEQFGSRTDPQLPEGDYILKDGAAWFMVSGFAVRIRTANDGSVVCSIYNEGQEDSDALAECASS